LWPEIERKVANVSIAQSNESEIAILARVLGDERGVLPHDLARYILNLGFNDREKARMHDLALRNQDDALTPAEKEELFAFGNAGDLLSILKSKARRSLQEKSGQGVTS
jgi:hypothetical protein